MIEVIKGNIFTTDCQTIVNTVNCVGIMGAGIALECKLRYPDMFKIYEKYCIEEKLDIGQLYLYKVPNNCKMILNFPSKKHWRYPTKLEYIELGLQKFVNTYKTKNITSIAFPVLGAGKGGVPVDISLNIMKHYLEPLHNLKIEIYLFDPMATDDLFLKFKETFLGLDRDMLKEQIKIRPHILKKIESALLDSKINNLSTLASVKGVGKQSLEKAFRFSIDNSKVQNSSLDDKKNTMIQGEFLF